MDIEINDSLKEMRPHIRRFVTEKMEPIAKAMDEGEELPRRAFEELHSQGYLGMRLPTEDGGGGFDMSTYCLIMEELSRSHRIFTLMLDASSGLTPIAISKFGTSTQKSTYLPKLSTGEWVASFALTEPEAGSDAQAIKTQAVPNGDGWVIDGVKHYISWAHRAQVIMVIALTDPAKKGRGGLSAFLVDKDTPNMNIVRVDKTIGSDAIELAEIHFTNCFVPKSALLGKVGDGFGIAMSSLTAGRMGVSAACLGAADRLIELASEHAKTRVTFGQSLAQRQAIQWMLADCVTELSVAKALAYETLRQIDAGIDTGTGPNMVKLYCSEMVGRVADRVVQIFGGSGLIRGFNVERFYRDVRHYRIGEGSSEIQRMLIAKDLFQSKSLT
jgi:acyl-CoA dehydrogenase